MSTERFGAFVRREREAREIGLREMAKMIGVSPTYLSKVERDEFPPPAEDKVKAIAQVIACDVDELLARAGKVASDLSDIIKQQPRELAALLRTTKGLSAEDVLKMARGESIKRSLPPAFYLMDESTIIEAHDALVAADTDLLAHVTAINHAMEFIDWLLRLESHQSVEHLALLRLGIRCFNSCGAALRLIRCGHWQPAIAVMRDIYETQFLLDWLSGDPKLVKEWISLPAKEREKKFKPVKVREALDQRDGFKEQKRAQRYKMLSTYGAHPSPEGVEIISPNGDTMIGPYPDQKLLKATIEELAMVSAHAAATISQFAKPSKMLELKTKLRFIHELEAWREKYLALQPVQDQ